MTTEQLTQQLYTAEEVATALAAAVSADWLLRAARRREIPHHKVGRGIRFSDDDIARLLASRAVEPETSAADQFAQTPRSRAAARRSRNRRTR